MFCNVKISLYIGNRGCLFANGFNALCTLRARDFCGGVRYFTLLNAATAAPKRLACSTGETM
jgi:hypothetical protein